MGKRLLVYVTQLMPQGGIESHILQFVKEMSSEDVTIDLWVPNFQMQASPEKQLKNYCRKLILNKSGSKGFKAKIWLFKQLLFLRRTTYDCLYTNGQGSSIAVCGRFTKFKKWVHHHHTSGDLHDQQTWGVSYRKALQAADVIIACSAKNAKDMSLSLNRAVMTIPCFSRNLGICEERKPTGAESKIEIGYYGRLIPEKGIDLLCKLSADEDCKTLGFNIWGSDPQYPDGFFRNFPNLRYHGSFEGETQLKKVVSSLDAFVLLSRHPEGLPISLLEVMSAGLPWLATDRGGITDIALDPRSTRVISYRASYNEFKQAILQLSEDIRENRLSRQQQINLYNQKFAAPVICKQWGDVLFKDLSKTNK